MTVPPVRLEFTYTPDDLTEWAKAPKPGMPSRGLRVWRGTITWLVFVALAVVIYVWQRRMEPPPPPPRAPRPAPRTANPLSDMLLMLLPWCVVFGVVWFLVVRQMRAGRSIWNNNRSLQLSHVLTVDDGGVELAHPTASTRWTWEAFTSWAETANLLLLRLQDNLTLAVPKRAATADELEALRRTFAARVAPPVGGFPVLPPGGAAGRGADAGGAR